MLGAMSRDVLPRGSILAKNAWHRWKDPEISQIWAVNEANQCDWPKETQKKFP